MSSKSRPNEPISASRASSPPPGAASDIGEDALLASGLRLFRQRPVVLLVAVGVLSHLGWEYWAGMVAVTALLAWPHVDIARRGLREVGMSFMSVNGAVGLLYGAVVVVATITK